MKFVLFYHSLRSDWNHGNAHFLRGVATELLARGHQVRVFEPLGNWSLANLLASEGTAALEGYQAAYPHLQSIFYDPRTIDLDHELDGADAVIVHEWNEHELVARIGRHRQRCRNYRLFFHDTHHRSVSDPSAMAAFDLSGYDGTLVFGAVLKSVYEDRGWTERAWTWHEAADVRRFAPQRADPDGPRGDLVWVGNWGDDERAAEIGEFLVEPVASLGLDAHVFGVRYPPGALAALAEGGIAFGGWIPNHAVPRVFAGFRATLHIPRAPYRRTLPGIPTIRVFEALAAGLPLVCAPWDDVERLFEPGDYLVARNGREMKRLLLEVLHTPSLADELATRGRRRILARHTCAHRVDELLAVMAALGGEPASETRARVALGGAQ